MIYESKGGFYKKTYKYHVAIGILVSVIILLGSILFINTKQLDSTRRSNDQLTERLADSTNSCTELKGQLGEISTELDDCRRTIEQCRVYCTDIDEISGRSIATARDAIEIIEETRYYVACLEVELGVIDTDSIYDRIDDWLESEGVKVVK